MMFAKGGGFADETTCVMIDNMPADFSQDNSILYVKDNGDDTLEYFADVNGKKTAVAKAVINYDAKTVDMFDGNGSLKGTIKDIELQKTGSVKIMPHYSNSTVDCITFEVDKSTLGDFVQVNPLNYRDNYADTWIATDNLGRRTPLYGEVSAIKDRKFGIYYFPWFTKGQTSGIVDHTKSYKEGGADKMWADFLTVPEGYLQYWSEPYFGYYQTEDDFVIRRHATMLANAGVDFVALDVSNGVMFPEEHEKIFRIWSEMRNEGNKTPQFVFLCGELPEANVSNLKTAWGMWYRDGKYEDLWFKWNGKPVVLANPDNITDQELLDFFTFRRSWAYKDWTGTGVNKWPWIDSTPQAPGYDENGNLEAISVACGFHANGSTGRSFHNGEQPTDGKNEFEFGLMDTTTPLGLAFQEQWDYAMTVDAPLVMICGWNEWAAGCWTQGVAGQKIANTYMWDPNDPRHKYFFVDNFNTEFSRDVEPMKGGFEDNYYYQMVQNIRKYRGARPVPAAAGQKTITPGSDFSQWDGVFPEYRDTLADVYHRDYDAVGGQGPHYTNTSGRNDIDYAKVSKDADYTYFYVRTTNDLTAPEGELWMNLFVNSDCQYGTGWKGYDFRINKSRNGSTCTIEKTDSTWEGYQVVGWAEFQYAGNQLQIKVPNSILNLAVEFEFKWADNSVSDGDAMKFWDMGDTAPDGKANYLYTPFGRELEFTPEATAALNGAVAMSVKKYNAFSGTKQVYIDPENSNVTPTIVNDRTMVPVRFVTENLNGQVEYNGAAQKITVTAAGNTIEMTIGKKQLVVNGKAQELDAAPCIIGDRTFLPLRALAEAMGKKVTWERRGLIIIGDAEVTDEAVLDEIYRLM